MNRFRKTLIIIGTGLALTVLAQVGLLFAAGLPRGEIAIVSIILPLFCAAAAWLWFADDVSFRRKLSAALKNRELEVHYQPFVRLRDHRIMGAEALLRWPGCKTSIERLVARAEQTGMIGVLTDYVIARVADDWPSFQAMDRDFRISINISAPDLASGTLCDRLKRLAFNLPAQALALEITERQSASLEAIALHLSQLRNLGYQVYVDDFGTGFSSMTRLLNLSVDGCKLDASFLKMHAAAAAISAMQRFAQASGVKLVVEGVETVAQQNMLSEINPDLIVQGWLFGRAAKKSELIERLKNQQRTLNSSLRASSIIRFVGGRA
ncbi:EAL domain-containing protein [Brucella pituitosa]|uniref:EAL domain-containing protein n=1 Tax=Brucella pituitosa TaxID=571256 RepID=UPI0013747BA9|nr:EAL domain-containing protein [Brucella pituitosa]